MQVEIAVRAFDFHAPRPEKWNIRPTDAARPPQSSFKIDWGFGGEVEDGKEK